MPEVNHLKAGTEHTEQTGHVLALRSPVASNCSECDWSSDVVPDEAEERAQALFVGYLTETGHDPALPMFQWRNQSEQTREGWRRLAIYMSSAP